MRSSRFRAGGPISRRQLFYGTAQEIIMVAQQDALPRNDSSIGFVDEFVSKVG